MFHLCSLFLSQVVFREASVKEGGEGRGSGKRRENKEGHSERVSCRHAQLHRCFQRRSSIFLDDGIDLLL